ncbi:MAG: hypothetical protein ABSC50_13485 [Candidatus Bathyarchaeia archaeon]
MLSKEMSEHLESNWAGVRNETKTVYVSRIKANARQALEDLTLIAEKLPEKHIAGIFTGETVVPFLKALVRMGPQFDPAKASGEEENRMRRVGQLCREILQELAMLGPELAPKARHFLLAAKTDSKMMDLQALLIGEEPFPSELPKGGRKRRTGRISKSSENKSDG